MKSASIITKRQHLPEREKLTRPEVYSEHHKSIVVDSRGENLSNLITNIEGSNWKVNYFQQVVDDHTALAGHNPNKEGLYQQYIKIINMILKVDTALNWTQNNENKSGYAQGSAYIYPPFVPNVGDMFIADIGDGFAAIFEIIVSEQQSLFKQSVYRVEYQSIDYAEGDRLVDLERKVVDTRYFELDFVKHGQNPVILPSEKKLLDTLKHYYPIIAENYFKKYFSERYACMVLPRDDMMIYDHFLTRAVSRWFTPADYYKLVKLRVLPIENIKAFKAESIFDLIEDHDGYAISSIFSKVGMVSEQAYATHGRIPQIARVGLDYLVYPIDLSYSVDTKDKYQAKLSLSPSPLPAFNGYTETEYQGIKLLPRLDLNNSYIFSPYFYQNERTLLSHLELETCRYLDSNNIIKEIIEAMIADWQNWYPHEQFYYTPILLMLMNASIRDL